MLAGRTARAGRAGSVYTLLRGDQVRHFKELLRRIDNNFVKKVPFDLNRVTKNDGQFGTVVHRFKDSLAKLKRVLHLERLGKLRVRTWTRRSDVWSLFA